MTRVRRPIGPVRTSTLAAVIVAFLAGVAVDSWLRIYGPPQPAESRPAVESTIAATHEHIAPAERGESAERLERQDPGEPNPVPTTGRSRLRVPLDGVDVERMKGGFAEVRTGHRHEAVDLLAPRGTPVHAVDNGTIAKLFVSKAGGNTIYQFDPAGRLCYYYAHLDRYANGLREGDGVEQGQVIGYVGTTGNAPPGTPHLHFAVFELGPEKHWWTGKAIDPYRVFKDRG